MRHNSLGLNSYLHATSPIRRYSDLLVFPFLLYNEGSTLNDQLNIFLSSNISDYKSHIIDKGLYYFNNQYYVFYEFIKKNECSLS